MLKTSEDVHQAIAELRATIRFYQAESKWAAWRSALQDTIALLDCLERRMQAVGWPPAASGAFDDLKIGLYAIRNLEELDDGRLADRLCSLDYDLKHAWSGRAGPSPAA